MKMSNNNLTLYLYEQTNGEITYFQLGTHELANLPRNTKFKGKINLSEEESARLPANLAERNLELSAKFGIRVHSDISAQLQDVRRRITGNPLDKHRFAGEREA